MDASEIEIGPARREDVSVLPEIEREAGALFANATVLLAGIGSLEDVTPVEKLAAAQQAGRLFVARTRDGIAVGFALVELVGGEPHLEEMDVRPAYGRRGIGRQLLAAVTQWVRSQRHDAITLTTFRDLRWNAPFYASAGFEVVAPDDLSSALEAVVRGETRRGLEPATRVVMRWRAGSG